MSSVSKNTKLEPITKTEIWAWYSYDGANSIYSGLVITLIAPLLMRSMAIQYACKDVANGCDINGDIIGSDETSGNARVPFFGTDMKPTSYATAILSLSTGLQAIVFISLGAAADYGGLKKWWLIISAIIGAVITMGQTFLVDDTGDNWLLMGILFIISNVFFGLSIVFYNAFLPVMAEKHERVIEAITNGAKNEEIEEAIDDVENEMSANGFAIGYCATVFALIIMFVIVVMFSTTYSLASPRAGVLTYVKDDYVDQRYGKAVTGAKVWSSTDQINGIQFYYDVLGDFGPVIGYEEGTLDDSTVTYPEATAAGVPYQDFTIFTANDKARTPKGLKFYRGLKNGTSMAAAEDFGDTSIVSNTITMGLSDEKIVLGGAQAWLDSESSSKHIAGLSLYFENTEDEDDFGGLKWSLLFAGGWWLVFTLVGVGIFLGSHPGPKLPTWNVVGMSCSRICGAIRHAKDQPHLFKFLIAYFIFSDGYSTMAAVGVLFASEEIHMSSAEITGCIVILSIFAAVGNKVMQWYQHKRKKSAMHMIWFCLWAWVIICVYVSLGLRPDASFGLVQKWEFYVFICVYGFFLAAIQANARVVMCQLVPAEREAEIFALYEITDKSSSWIGPLVVTFINEASNIRWAIMYCLSTFVFVMPILYTVNMEEGKKQAMRTGKDVAERLHGRDASVVPVQELGNIQGDV